MAGGGALVELAAALRLSSTVIGMAWGCACAERRREDPGSARPETALQ